MRRIDISSLFGWGEGTFFTILVFISVSLLLGANTAALILSIPEIVREVPKDHASYLFGTLELPHVIDDSDDITISIPDAVNVTDPFPVKAVFRDGSIPATNPYVEFRNGSESLYFRMGATVNGGRISFSVLVPGIPGSGIWSYRLVQFENGPDTVEIGSYSSDNGYLTASDPGTTRYLPVLDPELGAGNILSLRIIDPGTEQPWKAAIDPGRAINAFIDLTPVNVICNSIDMMIDIGDLEVGWHRLDLSYIEGHDSMLNDTATYLFYRNGESGIQTPVVTAGRVFDGYDEAFGQDREGIESFRWNSGILYSAEIYRIEAEYIEDPRGHIDIFGDDMRGIIPMPEIRAVILEKEYPMILDPGEGHYYAYVTTPSEITEDVLMTIDPIAWAGTSQERSIEILLRQDRTPDISFEPDPWDLRNLGRVDRLNIVISAGPYPLGYRDIGEQPDLMIDGTRYNMTVYREGILDSPDWYRILNMTGESASSVSLEVNGSYIHYQIPFFVLPWPPFVFGFPPVMFGWNAVLWFFMIFSFIMVSSGALLYRSVLGDGAGSEVAGAKKRRFRNPFRFDSEISTTYRIFMAIIFISLAVRLLFNLMDQSTPAPESLSTSYPIWSRMMGLATASVWEELIVRVLMIGLPLFLMKSIKTGRSAGTGGSASSGRWQFKELLGGRNVFGTPEVVLILMSSALFGMAHLGWGPWKVVPTFISGLLFGYLYVKVGLHASIVVHFLIDYTSFLNEITGSGVWIVILAFYISLILGGLFTAMLIVGAVKWFESRLGKEKVPGWMYLLIHSILSVLFGFVIILRGDVFLSMIFLQVPLFSILAVQIDRLGLKLVPRYLIFFISLMTFALAPVGMGWIIHSYRYDKQKIG
ncbi:MAG: CPBP family intramembrane glutamic endopeptidase [Thermoplasmatota archaeon]